MDEEVFSRWMGVFAERFNRKLEKPTLGVWYQTLSRELTTSEFEAACAIAFRDSTYWPTPRELIELVHPKLDVGLQAAEAFRKLITLGEPIEGYGGRAWRRDVVDRELGPVGIRCFDAIGANERLKHMSADDFPHVRREFIAAYRAAVLEKERIERADGLLARGRPILTLADSRPRRVTAGSGA